MRTVKVLALVAVVALAIPMANAADAKNSIGVFVNYLWPTGDYSGPLDEETEGTLEADAAMGYGLSYRYMFNERWDFGASIMFADHDVTADVTDEGSETIASISWMPILFDANFHLGKRFYVGPTLGYAMWDNLDITGGDSVAIKDDFVYGLNAGFDFPIGENWAINANARYLQIGAKTDEDADNITVDVNPWLLGVGVSYKF